jgi:putative membrane protein
VRTLARWVADSLAFFLALYLLDSLISPRFHLGALWIAVILAVFLGLLNSLIRPLYRVKSKPGLSIGEAVVTFLFNALVVQIAIWAGAPLSTTGVVWVFVSAAFLTLLGGIINWLIGFKQKDKPGAIARERRAARAAAEIDAKAPRTRP